MTDLVPIINVRGLERTFWSGSLPVRALRSCNLRVEAGEFVAVVGRSGSGKSTLLNLLGLLDRPTSGAYHLDGIPVNELSERERTALRGHKLGFIFQSFQLLPHRSCLENVMLAGLYRGLAERDRQVTASEALSAVGLYDKKGMRPIHLSGGEQQRVAIARALAADPRLLLCDEPTGNLDTTSSQSILDLFCELHHRGKTILMITHDPEVAHRADRQISIQDGVVSEVGKAG